MSTTKRVFAKLSAQEPMKVEFNAMLNSLNAGLKAQTGNAKRASDDSTKYVSDLVILKDKVIEQRKVNNSVISNIDSLIAEANKAIQVLESQAKELGLAANSIPVYGEIVKNLNTLTQEQKLLQKQNAFLISELR